MFFCLTRRLANWCSAARPTPFWSGVKGMQARQFENNDVRRKNSKSHKNAYDFLGSKACMHE